MSYACFCSSLKVDVYCSVSVACSSKFYLALSSSTNKFPSYGSNGGGTGSPKSISVLGCRLVINNLSMAQRV